MKLMLIYPAISPILPINDVMLFEHSPRPEGSATKYSIAASAMRRLNVTKEECKFHFMHATTMQHAFALRSCA